MSAKRAVIRLQLEISAKQALDRLCERRGMTQIAVLSRMVKWFVTQDEIVQASILGLLSENALGDLSRVLLARLASDTEGNGLADGKGGKEVRELKEAKDGKEGR
jgi:hypothetical protein